MKTKLFFISMMLFWGTMSELPIWGENNQFWGANNKYAMDASMLPTGAKAGLSIVPESLRVVGIRRSKLRHVWDPQDLTWDFDYSPDGRFLVIGGAGLTEDIRLFNAENLEFIGSGLYWYRIHSVTFRPDGRTIAGVTLDGRVHLIDRASLGIVSTLPGNAVIPIAWLSPDLSTLATERGDTDTSVLHWSDVRGNFTQTVRRQKETNDGYAVILSVGFDSSASTLASANQEGIIHLWDTGSGEHLQKFTQYRTDYDDDLYCPTEVYEVNVGDRFGGREYWRTEDPNLNPPRPDRYVMIAAHDHWHDSPESAEALKKIIHIHETTYKFEGSHNTLCGVSDWVGVDQPVKRLIGHEDTIWNVVYSTDRPQIASASYDDTIRIWNVNVKRGFQKEVFTSHTLRFSNIAFGRDGEVMAVGKIDGTIRLHVGDRWWHSFKAHAGPVTSVAFHPAWKSYTVPLINGESVEVSVTPTLASAGTDGRVRFWHLHMDTERVSPRTDPWVFYSKPLGSKEDFTRVSSLFAPSIDVGAVVTSVAFSPDGNTFAFGSWEGVKVLKLWNPPGRDELPTFYLFGSTESIPFRPSQPVMSVAYSPDGDTLAAGCLDGSIVLEDVREAMWTFNIGTLRGHKAGVFKVAFSSDGRTLASGSDDGTVLLWNHRPKRTSRLPFTIAGSDPSEPDVNNEPASMPEVDPEAPNTSIEPSRIEIRGSSTRSGTVNTELDAPLLVRVLDANGDVVEDASVIFRVQTGHGRLSQSGNRRTLSVDTDSRGLAQASYTPLSDSSTVSASVGGVSEGVTFTITATDAATPPTPDTGINLIVPVDAAKRPLMIWIDGGCNLRPHGYRCPSTRAECRERHEHRYQWE